MLLGGIDVGGPVIDLGEPQSNAFLLAPLPISIESLNGDSWATVGTRLRLRVPVDPASPPSVLRFRMRHSHARSVLAVIDGLPARQAPLPAGLGAATVSIPLTPDRFRRSVAEIELRFLGVARAAGPRGNGPRPVVVRVAPTPPHSARSRALVRRVRRALTPRVAPLPQPVIDIDWVHLAHGDTPVVRASDLVADVHADGPPRRALTLYAPTVLTAVTVIPPGATLLAALSAEGIRGATRGPGSVRAQIRVQADGAPPIEAITDVVAGSRWQEVSLNLAPIGGKAARITFAASTGAETRLAVADPRLTSRPYVSPRPPPIVRHVMMLVIRGARYDRFAPTLSNRFASGGFARIMQEALVARTVAPSPRSLSAFASAVTGLPAEVHQMSDLTDTLDETAPTLATVLHEAGVATAGFSDDRWWEGSGLDRGLSELGGCSAEAPLCRAETALAQAGEWLVREKERRAFVVVTTRAGIPPFDPPPDLLAIADPNPPENAITPERSAELANHSRRGQVNLDPSQRDRLAAMYDSALAGVDRGLSALLDRLRDASMLNDTAFVIVGDRGTALGESALVGDGAFGSPMAMAVVSHTVLIVSSPGVPAAQLSETASVLDAAATVLERLGVPGAGLEAGERAGAVSLFLPGPGGMHPRGVVLVANYRGDLGVRFGELIALGHGSGVLSMLQPDVDPLGQNDLALERPTAVAFAESVLANYRSRTADDPAARTYAPSTRTLSPAVEAALRTAGLLRR